MRVILIKLFDLVIGLLVILCVIGHARAETLPIDGVTTLSSAYYSVRENSNFFAYHPIYKKVMPIHGALDIPAKKYTPVRAVKAGTVKEHDYQYRSDVKENYGNYVMIKDEQGNKWIYAHLQNYDVKVGEEVAEGDVIGTVGWTGLNGCRPHLHLEKRDKNGKRIYCTKDFGITWTVQ